MHESAGRQPHGACQTVQRRIVLNSGSPEPLEYLANGRVQERSGSSEREAERFGDPMAPLVGVGTRERTGIVDTPHELTSLGSRRQSKRSRERRPEQRTDLALGVKENHHLVSALSVHSVRNVWGGEHSGSRRPP